MKTIIAIFFALGALLASLIANGQSKSDEMNNAFKHDNKVTNCLTSKIKSDTIAVRYIDEVNNLQKS
ncbi:MAG: hypothetical protein JXR61_04015 [Prolixibacteraceae bacterium]|nr:hypothetical protein [Prolixibacteraceae bacterium]